MLKIWHIAPSSPLSLSFYEFGCSCAPISFYQIPYNLELQCEFHDDSLYYNMFRHQQFFYFLFQYRQNSITIFLFNNNKFDQLKLTAPILNTIQIQKYFSYEDVGGQDLSFCVGLKAPFTNNNTSEEEKALGKAPQQVVVQKNVERHQSERVVLLEPDKCQSSQLHLDLCNLPENSSNENRLQASKERIRTRKYLGEKLLPPH